MDVCDKTMEAHEVRSFWDLMHALRLHPDWVEQMRAIILTTDLVDLPRRFDEFLKNDFRPLKGTVDGLSTKVDKIEGDVTVLKEDVSVLKQDVTVLKEDVSVLKQDVAVLKEDVSVLKQDVTVLKEDVSVLKQDVIVLKEDVSVLKQDVTVLKEDVAILKIDVAGLKGDVLGLRRDVEYLKGDMGKVKGSDLERRVRERAPAYFGRLLRKTKVISIETLAELVDDAEDRGIITGQERISLLNLDALISGEINATRKPVILAVEVSYTAHKDDIDRAVKRAQILPRILDREVIPVVASVEAKEEIAAMADDVGVLYVRLEY